MAQMPCDSCDGHGPWRPGAGMFLCDSCWKAHEALPPYQMPPAENATDQDVDRAREARWGPPGDDKPGPCADSYSRDLYAEQRRLARGPRGSGGSIIGGE
jgi:hypothetical protein